MSLTERVSFKTRLQRGNRVQVPKYVRWHYKLETTQILEVTVSVLGAWRVAQSFLSRIRQRWKNSNLKLCFLLCLGFGLVFGVCLVVVVVVVYLETTVTNCSGCISDVA